MASDPNPMSAFGRIPKVHADLLANDPYWARLEREHGGWKLFRVISPPPTQVPLDLPIDAR